MLRNPFGNVNPSANYNEWPLSKFSFIVNIGGMGGNLEFETMDGLGATIAKMEYRDGNSTKFYKQHRPTLTSYDPVTLKKGVFQGQNDLYDWFSNVAAGSLFGDSRTVTIQLTELNSGFGGESAGHQVHFQWTLEKAYVTKFTPPSLDGGAESEVAVEEVELSYQTFSTNANPLAALLGNLF
jgi:phage tail-like protein